MRGNLVGEIWKKNFQTKRLQASDRVLLCGVCSAQRREGVDEPCALLT